MALRRLIAGDDRLDIDPVPGASEPLAPEFERLYGTPQAGRDSPTGGLTRDQTTRTLAFVDGSAMSAHSDMPEPDRPLAEQPPEALTGDYWSAGVDIERRGDLRAAISNAMVALKKRFYGKGPERARTYLNDNYVFCALEGGLTRNEQTLVEAGEEEAVRQYRLLFQKTVMKTTTAAIEELTGRAVMGYHSQVTFHPTRSFEIFVLDGPAGASGERHRDDDQAG